jgi:hypothetical protein
LAVGKVIFLEGFLELYSLSFILIELIVFSENEMERAEVRLLALPFAFLTEPLILSFFGEGV